MNRRQQQRCPHEVIRGVYGDEIKRCGGFRLLCVVCGRYLDGPVSLAAARPRGRDALRQRAADLPWRYWSDSEDLDRRTLGSIRTHLSYKLRFESMDLLVHTCGCEQLASDGTWHLCLLHQGYERALKEHGRG